MPTKFEVFKDKRRIPVLAKSREWGDDYDRGSYPDKAACKKGIASIKGTRLLQILGISRTRKRR